VIQGELKVQNDENRVTYNSDKTFSVKSGMLNSNAPMKINQDYEAAPNDQRVIHASKRR